MPAVISNATRIWEQNIYWTLNSQCGTWDSKSKGVEIWECIRDRELCTYPSAPTSYSLIPITTDRSTQDTQVLISLFPPHLLPFLQLTDCHHSRLMGSTGDLSRADNPLQALPGFRPPSGDVLSLSARCSPTCISIASNISSLNSFMNNNNNDIYSLLDSPLVSNNK
jgi:hypothetical protein